MKEPKPCIRAFLRRLLPLLLLVFFVNIPFHADAAVTSTDDIRISKGGKFVHISGQWYKYLQKDGTYAKDCLMNINGKIYYFSQRAIVSSAGSRLEMITIILARILRGICISFAG